MIGSGLAIASPVALFQQPRKAALHAISRFPRLSRLYPSTSLPFHVFISVSLFLRPGQLFEKTGFLKTTPTANNLTRASAGICSLRLSKLQMTYEKSRSPKPNDARLHNAEISREVTSEKRKVKAYQNPSAIKTKPSAMMRYVR
jgi:hypothetical protein